MPDLGTDNFFARAMNSGLFAKWTRTLLVHDLGNIQIHEMAGCEVLLIDRHYHVMRMSLCHCVGLVSSAANSRCFCVGIIYCFRKNAEIFDALVIRFFYYPLTASL
jgi:hypothetical protein